MSEIPPDRFRQTKTARLARRRLAQRLEGLDSDAGVWRRVQERVPEAWAWLEEDLDLPEAREKISLRLDRSVVKLFRAMGPGYQHAINRVLATYAQMKIAEVERERPRAPVVEMPQEAGEAADPETNRRAMRARVKARLERRMDERREAFLMTAPTRKELEAWERENRYWE